MNDSNPVKARLTIISLFIIFIFSSFPWSFYGMNWTDNSQIFHFANRMANGEFPYRDFSYQTGFIGLSIDALFQQVFGQTYLVSLTVRLLVKIGTLFCFYAAFRQYISRLGAAAICTGIALYFPNLSGGGNTNWADLFIAIAVLFLTLGCNQLGSRKATMLLAIAGFAVAGAIGSRQSNGMICALVLFSVLLIYTMRKPSQLFKSLLLPVAGGFGLGLSLIAAILGANSAFSAAVYELFIAASERKNVSLIASLIDALSGGVAISDLSAPIELLKSIIKLVLIPLMGAIAILILLTLSHSVQLQAASETEQPNRFVLAKPFNASAISAPTSHHTTHHTTVFHSNLEAIQFSVLSQLGIALLPVLVMIGLTIDGFSPNQTGISSFSLLFYDFPRTFFSLTLALGCFFPKLSQRLLGVAHPLFPLITALVLGTVWAMQLSWVGRYYIDLQLLISLVFLLTAMTSKLSHAWKRTLALLFLAAATTIFTYQTASQLFGQTANQYSLNHAMTPVIKVNQEKAIALSVLQESIQPGDSCFIYGSASVLYTLLDCENPTRLDITNSDALTLQDAQQAAKMLTANPPEWIIDTGKGDFYINDFSDGSPNFYGPFNQAGAHQLHTELRSLLQNYQLVSNLADFFPKASETDPRDRDRVLRFRLYRYQQ